MELVSVRHSFRVILAPTPCRTRNVGRGREKSKLAKISPGPEECKRMPLFHSGQSLADLRLEYGGMQYSAVSARDHPATTPTLQDDQDMKRLSVDLLMQAMKPAESEKSGRKAVYRRNEAKALASNNNRDCY